MIRRTACVCFVLAGCARTERDVEFAPQQIKTWPAKSAERVLRVVTDRYAIYAQESDYAEALHAWLGDELAEAQVRYGTAIGRGLVLAIESHEEPFGPLQQWREHNVNRYREISWHDPVTGSGFHGFGRPYCLVNGPYYTESYALPYDAAVKLGLIAESSIEPAWICILATDEHRAVAFKAELRRVRAQLRTNMQEGDANDIGKEPILVRLGHIMLYRVGEMFFLRVFIPRYSTIDRELMHLQRRETVFGAIITAVIEDGSARNSALSSLRDEIDELWKNLFLDRPVE